MSGHGGGGGDERWLVSYADFITLLMVLFVVLYSMGQTDIQRYKALAEGLRSAFSGGEQRLVDPGIYMSGAPNDESAANPIVIPGIPQAPVGTSEVAGELTSMLAASDLDGSVSVQNNIEGMLISLSEQLVFDEGTANLHPEAYPVLDIIVKMVKDISNEIRIIGYTDDQPPVDPTTPNNWALSVKRAAVISEYFQAQGISPERILIAGRGEHKPLFPNDSDEHRAMNSRAEIIVVYPVAEDIINLNLSPSPSTIDANLDTDIQPEIEPEH